MADETTKTSVLLKVSDEATTTGNGEEDRNAAEQPVVDVSGWKYII